MMIVLIIHHQDPELDPGILRRTQESRKDNVIQSSLYPSTEVWEGDVGTVYDD